MHMFTPMGHYTMYLIITLDPINLYNFYVTVKFF